MRSSILIFLFFIFCSTAALSASTVGCHCFQDRQYNPQKSGAADPYFLATTQNSFLAVLYKVEKKSLVRAKMSGADGESLWIAHSLAGQSSQPLSAIDRLRAENSSWVDVVERLGIKPERLKTGFIERLNDPDDLAAFVVDEALVTDVKASPGQLDKLHELGVANKERILAVLLGRVSGASPVAVYERFQKGESWGELLYQQGLFDGAAIERQWRQLLTH